MFPFKNGIDLILNLAKMNLSIRSSQYKDTGENQNLKLRFFFFRQTLKKLNFINCLIWECICKTQWEVGAVMMEQLNLVYKIVENKLPQMSQKMFQICLHLCVRQIEKCNKKNQQQLANQFPYEFVRSQVFWDNIHWYIKLNIIKFGAL